MLGDVLTYWEEEPTSRERWLHGKMWWASRVHFGFRQLYCGNYEPPPHEAVQEQARRVHFGRRSSKPLDDVDQDAVKVRSAWSAYENLSAVAAWQCACAGPAMRTDLDAGMVSLVHQHNLGCRMDMQCWHICCMRRCWRVYCCLITMPKSRQLCVDGA